MKRLIGLTIAALAAVLFPIVASAQIPVVEGVSLGLRAIGALSSARQASDIKDVKANVPSNEELERRIDEKVKGLPEAAREKRREELRAMYAKAFNQTTAVVGGVGKLTGAAGANPGLAVLSRVGLPVPLGATPAAAAVLAAGERAANASAVAANTSTVAEAAAPSAPRQANSNEPAFEPKKEELADE